MRHYFALASLAIGCLSVYLPACAVSTLKILSIRSCTEPRCVSKTCYTIGEAGATSHRVRVVVWGAYSPWRICAGSGGLHQQRRQPDSHSVNAVLAQEAQATLGLAHLFGCSHCQSRHQGHQGLQYAPEPHEPRQCFPLRKCERLLSSPRLRHLYGRD
jgi:hypothetical protein